MAYLSLTHRVDLTTGSNYIDVKYTDRALAAFLDVAHVD